MTSCIMFIKDYEKICEKEEKWAPRDRIRELLRKSPEKNFCNGFLNLMRSGSQ